MSFGFSISDFLSVANITLQVYDALKTGSAECQAFSRDMLLFHDILQKLARNLVAERAAYDLNDRAVLQEHSLACHNFLWSEVFGNGLLNQPHNLHEIYELEPFEEDIFPIDRHPQIKRLKPSALSQLQAKIRSARFARRIPKLQRSVTAQIEKLTAYNVLLMQSSQTRVASAQIRIEASQKQVEDGQVRMESMLRNFLTTQQRNGTPLTSCSLQSSSPEGINVCMSLYKALRKEGITPQKIKDSQQILVKAMKRTLGTSEAEAQSLASTVYASFRTAPEHIDNSISFMSIGSASSLEIPSSGFAPALAQQTDMYIYGSAPPSRPSFPHAFLKRHPYTDPEYEDDPDEHGDREADYNYSTERYLADSIDLEHFEADEPEKGSGHILLSDTDNELDDSSKSDGHRLNREPAEQRSQPDSNY